MSSEYKIRPASIADAELLFRWANDPETRKNAFNSETLAYASHLEWLESKLGSASSAIFILEMDGKPVAQVRFDKISDFAEVDISTAKDFRGLGLGCRILRMTAGKAVKSMDLSFIKAIVFKTNIASLKTFEKAGFKMAGEENIKGKDCFVFTYEK